MPVPNVGASFSISEYTDTVGVGNYALRGAVVSSESYFFRFRDAYSDGDSVDYWVSDGPNIEIGTGILTYGDPDTLSRDTILASSNGGSLVDWLGNTRPILRATIETTGECIPTEIINVYNGTSI
jgi:hypothetical protein